MARCDAISALKQLAEEHRFFRQGAPVVVHAANACLDVLGALESEAGGTLAQMTLPTQAAVGVQSHGQATLRVRSAQISPPVGDAEVTLPLEPIRNQTESQVAEHLASLAGTRAGWAAPVLALFWQLLPPGHGGISVLIHSDIPPGAGQASSTALLAALALALCELDKQPAPPPLAVAQWAATAESLGAPRATRIHAAPTRLHVINAMTCLQPRDAQARLLRYSAQPPRLIGPVPLPKNIRVLALDTGVRYTSVQATLDELHVAAAMGTRIIETIYRDLGQSHTPLHGALANTSPLLYRQYFRMLLPRRLRGGDFTRTYGALPDHLLPLGAEDSDTARLYRVRTAVDHLIAENEHAEQFLQAMEELADADSAAAARVDEAERQRILQRAGRLLLASHHSYRLRLELSCREADWLVDRLMEAGPDCGVFGARITGAGGGGTVAALLDRSSRATDAILAVMKSYHQLTGLTLCITEA